MYPIDTINLAIIDDQLMNQRLVQLYLSQESWINLALISDDGFELFKYLNDNKLDVVLLDLQMPKISGFDICTQLRQKHPDVKILIVSQLTDDESVHKIMLTGAHGFFSKNSDPSELANAIDRLISHGYFFSMDLQAVIAIANDLAYFKKSHLMPLEISPAEKAVLQLTSKGLSNKLIAIKQKVSVRTIEKHKENILKKTGQSNVVGALVMALKNNVIQLGDL